jgi:hypothetical protein
MRKIITSISILLILASCDQPEAGNEVAKDSIFVQASDTTNIWNII